MRRPSASARRSPDRRGITLVVVMAAVAACLVIAMAFLHAETAALRTLHNARSVDRACEAAESGMAALLSDMQSPSWAGIDTVLAAEVGRDGGGIWSYKTRVTAKPGDGTLGSALTLSLKSTGTYQSFDSPRPVERVAQSTVRLVPRVPASGTPSDRRPDATWDAVQGYALAAGTYAELPPQTRFVGDAWIDDNPRLYHEVAWPAAVRARAGADNPDPVTGTLALRQTATVDEAANLTALLGSGGWIQASTPTALPAVSLAGFATTQDYRLYQGGPPYRSVVVGSTLGALLGVTELGPTAGNPLGIFYRAGDIDLNSNVRITGTLVATGRVRFRGTGIEVRAVRVAGSRVTSLPAVLAGSEVWFEGGASAVIDGLVYAAGTASRDPVDRHAAGRVTVDGGVVAGALDLGTPPMWQALSSSDWSNRNSSCPTGTPFLPWLANAGNWPVLFWPLDYSLHGLSNEPTFLVTRPAGVEYVAAPPLFRPDPAAWNAGGGYRWEIVSWSEVR